jgi:hypothetical protein
MSIKKLLAVALTSLVCTAGTPTFAADPATPAVSPAPAAGAMEDRMHHGKRCDMHHSKMKHGHHMPQMIMLPRLPHGNEKLQLQMHAEILQKVGEIEARYAAKLP